MDEIIARLIEARRNAKLSLQDIQQRTKIPLRQLEYLESFQYDKIGPRVYIKGFVRRYAQEVGIDADTLWEQEGSQVVVTPPRSARHRRQPSRFNLAPFLRITAILALLVIVGVLIRTAILTYFEPDPPAPPDVPPGQDNPGPGDDEDPIDEPEPEPKVSVEQLQADDSEAIYVVRNAGALDVVLTFSDKCWTRIIADGETISETTYTKGQTQHLTDADVLRIRFGAPKFVAVTVNGKEIETPKLKKGFNLEIRLEQTE